MKQKYFKIYKHLSNLNDKLLCVKLSELEEIMGENLPKSAKTYTAWWNPAGHPHTRAWTDAGFTASVDITNGLVTFVKKNEINKTNENLKRIHPTKSISVKETPSKIANHKFAMQKVILISCSKKKLTTPNKAEFLYSPSSLFSKSLAYARTLAPDKDIYILSAKYHLLKLTDFVEPYDKTLQNANQKVKKEWASIVYSSIIQIYDPQKTEFIFLAGHDYASELGNMLPHTQFPLQGLQFGPRLSYLDKILEGKKASSNPFKKNVTETESAPDFCLKLHSFFNKLPRFYANSIDDIPFENGIYVIFEKGELFNNYNRIVRIGTHTKDALLKNRLKNHFIRENKDGSIFRKNVGRAMLNRINDNYLNEWNSDGSNNSHKRVNIEKQVTQYLTKNTSISCIPVETKELRLRLEEGIIATLNKDLYFRPSDTWLGLYNPNKKIQESGLWLVQGLSGTPLTHDELNLLYQ